MTILRLRRRLSLVELLRRSMSLVAVWRLRRRLALRVAAAVRRLRSVEVKDRG